MNMKQEDKDTLQCERQSYNDGRRTRTEIQELRAQIQELGGTVSTTRALTPPDTVSVSQRSLVSQITATNNSIMGWRNEQAHNGQVRREGAVTTHCHVRSSTMVNRSWIDPPISTMEDNECETNDDFCCLCKNLVVLHATYRTADVYAYNTSITPIKNVLIVSEASTAYDDPVTGSTYILVFNESLYYGERLDHSLINPNQLQAYGILLWHSPYDSMHDLSIEVTTALSIPLRTFGTEIVFRTRVPTSDKLCTCEHVQMTSPSSWNQSDVIMVQATAKGGRGQCWKRRLANDAIAHRSEYIDAQSNEALLDLVDPSLALVADRLHKRYHISPIRTVYDNSDSPACRTFMSNEQHAKVLADLIAERFGIEPIQAQRTLRVTTQRGVRSAILPISRRYCADRVVNVKQLNGKFVTDIGYGKLRLLRGKIGCQLYSLKCGFKVRRTSVIRWSISAVGSEDKIYGGHTTL